MVEPTEADIGRAVCYKQGFDPVEEGVITSFNDNYVFVRYGSDKQSKATKRRDLAWTHETQ